MTVRPSDDGRWRVTMEVTARKTLLDQHGRETEVPMDDLVEVGVYAEAGNAHTRGQPLHLPMHRVYSGVQQISIDVTGKPADARVDPRHLLTVPR